MARLVVGKGKSKGKWVQLPDSGELIIGRELGCDLPIRDAQASRRHFKVVVDDGAIAVHNLKSVNGTWINGEKLDKVEVTVGDKIRAGQTLLFVIGDKEKEDEGHLTGQEISGYKLGRLLGRGGMGNVYEARQLSLDRIVAFKVLARQYAENEEFVDGFLKEARAAGRLNHQNIVQVYDVGESDGTYFYSLEYMANGSVEDLISKLGKIPVDQVLTIAIDAARGLQYAEKKGLIHRDIKPGNLFLSSEGVTKLGDLGIAQIQETPGEQSSQQKVSGSPHYIAPEQALGKDIDSRVDLYALGVSLYEMLTGEVPFTGSSPQEIILKHIHEEAPTLHQNKDIPPEMARIVADLMEKDADKRIANAGLLIQRLMPMLEQFPPKQTTLIRLQSDLNAGTSDEHSVATPPPTPQAPAGPSVWPKLVMGLGAVAVVLCLLGALVSAIAKKKKLYNEQVQRVQRHIDEIKEVQDPNELKERKTQLGILKADLEARKYPDLVTRVEELQGSIDERLKTLASEKFEGEAEKAFAPLKKRSDEIEKWGESEKFLNELIADLKAFLKTYNSSKQGGAGRDALAQAEDALEQWGAIKRRRKKANDLRIGRVNALAKTIKALLEQDRFADALEEVNRFKKKYSGTDDYEGRTEKDVDLYEAASRRYRQRLFERARFRLEDFGREVNKMLVAGDFDEARQKVKDLKNVMKLPHLDPQFLEMTKKIDDTEKAMAEAEKAKEREQEQKKFNDAQGLANAEVRVRHFDKASRLMSDASLNIDVEDIRKAAERRALLYRSAQNAIRNLVKYIKKTKRQSNITHIFIVGGSEKQGVAVDGDAEQLYFEVQKGVGYNLSFKKLSAPEFFVLFTTAPFKDMARLELAALAWALGLEDDARKHKKMVSQTPAEGQDLDKALQQELP